MITKQNKIYMTVTTKLGKDKIFLRNFHGFERMSQLFEFRLELYIPFKANPKAIDLDFSKLIEKEATVEISIDKKKRFFHGMITELTQGPTFATNKDKKKRDHEATFFYATLRPKAWLMTLTEHCEIFQKKDAISIIKEVLGNHKVTLKDKTSKRGKEKREFCVQYNESDFNFICRLMEEEGISYYFKHEKGKHTMTLVDGAKPLDAIKAKGFKTIKVSPYPENDTPFTPALYDVRVSQRIIPSAYMHTDYDFEKPKTALKAESKGKGKLRDYFHFPGEYIVKKSGKDIADVRMEELEFPKDSVSAKSDVHMFEIAHTFKVSDELRKKALRKDINKKEFAVFSLEHSAAFEDLEEDDPDIDRSDMEGGQQFNYKNNVVFYKKDVPYRPARTTPIPRIYGTQTATVSGKAKEEIYTDKYGRVMVKFHWDLSKTKDDKVSCWVRVAQGWTGKKWGAYFIPRVGQEVVVTFLNGNPDDPLITGCVYNGINTPPYGPKQATKSGWKTNTSKGGKGFNELHFEDKKGKEDFYMHAQRDMTTMVLDGKRFTTIKGTKGKGDDILMIKKGKRETTLSEGDDLLTLTKGNRKTTLTKGDDTTKVAAGNSTTDVSKNYILKVGKDGTIKIGGNLTLDVGKNFNLKVGKDYIIKASKIVATGKMGVDVKGMKVGIDAKTAMKISGLQVDIKAKAMLKGAGPMVSFKGAAMAKLEAGGVVMVKGAMATVGAMVKLG